MLPLDREAMGKLLREKLVQELPSLFVVKDTGTTNTNQNNIVLEMDAVDYLLDNGLEWQTWVHKKTNVKVLEFCPFGAKALISLIGSIIKDCQTRHIDDASDGVHASSSITTLSLLSDNVGRFQLMTCSDTVGNDDNEKGDCTINCQFVL